jgi:sarcosine oxidase delta subunit
VNGPAPLTHPYPDPRSYLPFVRDEKDILDREPVAVPDTHWNDYFWLTENAGTMEMWQARRNPDGTINERFRQLQNGREWGMKDARTIQLTLPFSFLSNINPDTPPTQIEANLAVGTRALSNQSRGFMIERWGRVQNTFFAVQTRPINQNLYDTVSGVTFPNNVPQGIDPTTMNFVSITYRVVYQE